MQDETSPCKNNASMSTFDNTGRTAETGTQKTLKDAVKQKNRKKKNRS